MNLIYFTLLIVCTQSMVNLGQLFDPRCLLCNFQGAQASGLIPLPQSQQVFMSQPQPIVIPQPQPQINCGNYCPQQQVPVFIPQPQPQPQPQVNCGNYCPQQQVPVFIAPPQLQPIFVPQPQPPPIIVPQPQPPVNIPQPFPVPMPCQTQEPCRESEIMIPMPERYEERPIIVLPQVAPSQGSQAPIIIKSPPASPSDVKTEITLSNVINNDNSVHTPTNIDSNNVNDIKIESASSTQSENQKETVDRSVAPPRPQNNPIYIPHPIHIPVPVQAPVPVSIPQPQMQPIMQMPQRRCCTVIAPRQCYRASNRLQCNHQQYQRCGSMCTRNTVVLPPQFASGYSSGISSSYGGVCEGGSNCELEQQDECYGGEC